VFLVLFVKNFLDRLLGLYIDLSQLVWVVVFF
jgi:hypothetical protein